MRRILLIIVMSALVGCGGGGSDRQEVTPPGESLTGTYSLAGYYIDNVLQSGYSGTMEIGETQIKFDLIYIPPLLENGTFDYAISGDPNQYMTMSSNGQWEFGTSISNAEMFFVMAEMINNVQYVVWFEKTSNGTILK